MENQNKDVNGVNGENNDAGQEPVTVITTKEALKAIGHNAKVKAKATWTKAKPVLKKVAITTAIIGGAAYAIDKMNQPALEQKDNDWHDDDIVIDSTATVMGIDDDQATGTEGAETPAENAE